MLPLSEQLKLIERLIHRAQQNLPNADFDPENQLPLMAADPDIQKELRAIEREFAPTESDGLATG